MSITPIPTQASFVEWSTDTDMDWSWLDQPDWAGQTPDDFKAVEIVSYEVQHEGTDQERHDVLHSLCGITFGADDPVFEGRVYTVEEAFRLLQFRQMTQYQFDLTVDFLQGGE